MENDKLVSKDRCEQAHEEIFKLEFYVDGKYVIRSTDAHRLLEQIKEEKTV